MPALKFNKVSVLPSTLEADAFYFVENGTFAESYLTNSAGTARSIGNSAMIESVVTPLINSAVSQLGNLNIVPDIAARDALTLTVNAMVLVTDASADPTVDAGAALYVYDATEDTYIKVAEYESMDVTLTWSQIQGRPTSSVSLIDDAVTKRHEHSNKAQLDKIGETGGQLTYDGTEVGANWKTTNW